MMPAYVRIFSYIRLNWLSFKTFSFLSDVSTDRTLERAILVHLAPAYQEETLDTAGKVFFIDTVEETEWQEQLIS